MPPFLSYPAVSAAAKLFGGFSLNERAPIDAIKSARVPVLLIHGEKDSFVPPEMSDELSAVGNDVTYLKVKNAPHLMSMMYDEKSYTDTLDKFLNRILNKQ